MALNARQGCRAGRPAPGTVRMERGACRSPGRPSFGPPFLGRTRKGGSRVSAKALVVAQRRRTRSVLAHDLLEQDRTEQPEPNTTVGPTGPPTTNTEHLSRPRALLLDSPAFELPEFHSHASPDPRGTEPLSRNVAPRRRAGVHRRAARAWRSPAA